LSVSIEELAVSINFGTKRTVVGAHYGLRDWLSQRVTAVAMAVFTIALLVQVLLPGNGTYAWWSAIFSNNWMKQLTLIAVVSMAWHAWVGMRDIWMDYVKPVAVKLVLQVITIVWLLGCAGWALQVLWRL